MGGHGRLSRVRWFRSGGEVRDERAGILRNGEAVLGLEGRGGMARGRCGGRSPSHENHVGLGVISAGYESPEGFLPLSRVSQDKEV